MTHPQRLISRFLQCLLPAYAVLTKPGRTRCHLPSGLWSCTSDMVEAVTRHALKHGLPMLATGNTCWPRLFHRLRRLGPVFLLVTHAGACLLCHHCIADYKQLSKTCMAASRMLLEQVQMQQHARDCFVFWALQAAQ